MATAAKTAAGAERDTAERVLASAARLFYANGVRAVGVEWIVADSGVAKTSLYRHFKTKDDLVAAFLTREDREFWTQWDQAAATARGGAQGELMALLEWIGRRVARDGYRGCPQINVAAEFADAEHPARRLRRLHKARMQERLGALAQQLKVRHPEDLALQLALLIDGAFTSDGRLTRANAVRVLQAAARALIDGAR